MGSEIRPRVTTIDGLSIRHAESGNGECDAILLSPWPQSLYAFEQCWAMLAQHAHLLAIDPPGFGMSEYRDELMDPQMMGDFIIRAADAFGMRHPHLVGPGVGTPSTLFATAAQPGRFPSLVVGGGVSAVPLRLGLLWQELVHNTELELYGPLGGEAIVEAALASITGHTGPEEIHEDYLASSRGERFVAALHYAQSFTHRIPLLADLLPSIHTPVRIVAGADDKLVPNVNAEFLHQRLPVSRLDLIDGAGHFCWEEKPHAYGSLVTQWWQQVGSP